MVPMSRTDLLLTALPHQGHRVFEWRLKRTALQNAGVQNAWVYMHAQQGPVWALYSPGSGGEDYTTHQTVTLSVPNSFREKARNIVRWSRECEYGVRRLSEREQGGTCQGSEGGLTRCGHRTSGGSPPEWDGPFQLTYLPDSAPPTAYCSRSFDCRNISRINR